MLARSYRDAVEDARGVMMGFGARSVGEDDCLPAVRAAIAALETAIDGALARAHYGDLRPDDREEIDRCVRALVRHADQCGPMTQSLMFDIKNLFGRYLELR